MAGVDILLKMTSSPASSGSSNAPSRDAAAGSRPAGFEHVLAGAVRQGAAEPDETRSRPVTPPVEGVSESDSAGPVPAGSLPEGAPRPETIRKTPSDEPRAEDTEDNQAEVAAGSMAAASSQPVAHECSSCSPKPLSERPDVSVETAVVPLWVLPPEATLVAPAGLAEAVSDAVASPAVVPVGTGQGAIDVSSLAGELVEQLPAPPEAALPVALTEQVAASASEDAVTSPVVDPAVTIRVETAVPEAEAGAKVPVVAVDEITVERLPAGSTSDEASMAAGRSNAGQPAAKGARSEPAVVVAIRDLGAANVTVEVNRVGAPTAARPVPAPVVATSTPVAQPVPVVPAAPVQPVLMAAADDAVRPVAADEVTLVEAKPAARVSVAVSVPAAPSGLLSGLWGGVTVPVREPVVIGATDATKTSEGEASGSDWSQLIDGDPLQGVLSGGSSVAGKPGNSADISVGHTSSTGAVGSSKPTVAPVLDQVTSGVLASHRGGHEVRLRLNPPELGALLIDVAVKDGVLTARLETTQAGTQQLLSDNLAQLREALTQQGLVVEKIDVSLGDSRMDNSRGEGSSGMMFSDGRGRDDRAGTGPAELGQDPVPESPVKPAVPRPKYLSTGQTTGLDVEV